MGKIINEWVKETLLTEDIKKQIVVYAGRFQPFHKGHYASYQQLVKKFGKDNVYIGTSDKTDNIKSPLRFKEKKAIMMTMFGIPSNKIVQIKNPYAPMEIMGKFPEETTAFITVVGEKDRYRLKGKYFEPYHPDRVTKGYKEAGYVYVTTAQGPAGGMSGTEARELLLKGSEADKIAGFKKVYDGKFDSKIYKLITTKLEKVFGKLERFISTIDMNQLMMEAGIYRADPGEPETGYLPGGTTRKLGDNFGKPEPWYSNGGYTQMEFPKADYIYSKDSTGSDKAAFSVVKRIEPNKDLDKPIEADDYLTSETGEPIIGMNEASSLGPLGKSMVDDGPGFTYGNSKSYRKVGDDTAEALGWQVVDYILGNDDDSIYADSLRTLDDKYPVSYFPSGHEGIDAQSQRYNIMKSSDAYKAWSKKIKGVATAVGYQLIDFLDAEDSKTNNPNEPTKETTPNFTVDSKTERLGEGIRENVAWQQSVVDFINRGLIPLSPSIINKMIGNTTVRTWHTTDVDGVDKIMKLKGKQKSLSTFDASDPNSVISGYGVRTYGGIVVGLTGTLLAKSWGDMMTRPDKQGRRWVSPHDVGFGNLNLDKPTLDRYTMSPKEINNAVTKYIDDAYKEMYKNSSDFISSLISSARGLGGTEGWNEVVVNKINPYVIYVLTDGRYQVSALEFPKLKRKYGDKVEFVTTDELKKIFKKRGGYIRESTNKIQWQDSVSAFMRKGWVPLSTSIINKMIGGAYVQTWHVTDASHIGNIMKLEGKKKSLSTFNASDSVYSPITGKGMWTKGGVVVQMAGRLLAQGKDDLWSAPDKQGRRWVDPKYLFGDGVLSINRSGISDTMSATEKRDAVKKYIDNAYKEMYKHRLKFIKKMITDDHSLYYDADYNEVIVNNIVVQDVFAIKGQVSDADIEILKKHWDNVKVVTEDELKKIFKKNRGYLREDAGPKWQRSTFELMQKRHVPLSPSIVNKMLGDITVEVYHTTDNNGLDKLMKLQGKKKSISTFDASDVRGPAAGFGMWTKGGIVAKIEGTLLARSVADLWSKPDKQGRRWVSTVNGFGRTPFEFGLPEIEKPKEEYTPEELRQLTKDYIDTAYEQMYKHRDEFRRRSIESANKLNASDGWNEAVVNNIKVTALYVNKLIYSPYEIRKIKQKYKVPVITAASANDIANKLRDNGVHIRDNVNNNRTDILTEGGAYGHMNHPFDVEMNLTFGDLKAIIKGALTGNLEFAREKTDGQALAISWRNDRGLIAARNKGHLKNRGENALNIKGMADKFAGRGGLTDAYNFAMKDLEKAIKGLTSKQRDKIFQNGGSFMNLEVIYPTSVNVIPYGQPLLVFHGTMQYNEDGIAIGENAEAGRMLAGMIKQVNAHVQDNYTISGPTVTELPKSVKLSSLQGKFTSQLSKLQSEFNLKDADGVAEYHQSWWMDWIKKNSPAELNDAELKGLVTRWAFFDKKFALNNKTISNPDVLSWAKKIDKQDHSKMAKDNLRRFEDIFLGVGAEVLSFMDSIITVSPDKATRDMKTRLDQTIKDVKSSGDPKKIQKLKSELERLQAIGGSDKIVPNEGIVFTYKGNTYKLTGAFASLNQILGLMYF